MKRYLFWLKIEWERAVALLPQMIAKVFVLILLICMSVFLVSQAFSGQVKVKQISIGFVAEENELTDALLMFVGNMESVKKWCNLVSVSQEEGMEMLKQGELLGLAILPDNVIEEILSGSNAPAKLYLAEDLAPLGVAFDELASAAVGLLQLAQAQVYATYDMAGQWNISKAVRTKMCDEINSFNLQLALNRESLFKTEQLSKTGQDSFLNYYGGALMTLYLLLAGLFFGKYIKRSSLEQEMLEKRVGISKEAQLGGRMLMTTLLLLTAVLLLLPLLTYVHVNAILQIQFSWQNLCLLLMVLFCVAAMLQLLYMIADNHRYAVLLVGMNGVIMGYLGGCFLPTPLLPQIVEKVAAFLPVYYIKYATTMLFAEREGMFGRTVMALLLWICLLLLGARLLMREHLTGKAAYNISIESTGKKRKRSRTMFGILAKRLLSKVSLWVTLGVVLLLSVIMVNAEKKSQTSVYAAVFTEDAKFEKIFTEYEGVVQFVLCSSPEEVKRNVIQGKTECGYILQEDLQKRFLSEDAEESIIVYKDADATLTNVVNEIVFEKIFYEIMTDWFAGYIAESDAFAQAAEEIGTDRLAKTAGDTLKTRLTDGSTFYYERQYVKAKTIEGEDTGEGRSVYPVRVISWLCIVLCTLIGCMETVADRRRHKFRGNAKKAAVITILQTFACGVAAAVLIRLLA